MTLIKPVTLRCTSCLHKWKALEGASTNTFGMNDEEAKSHLDSFWRDYGQPEKTPCPECGSKTDKEVLR